MTKKALTIILAVAIILQPCVSVAKSGWEFYFFGVNLKVFKESNWLMVAVGAATSLLTHEFGHALYLESQGKNWDISTSASGFVVRTNDNLQDSQYRNFGRSGFAVQTGIGVLLTSFESTRHLDFTKGWVGMNTAQLYTYDLRGHNDGNDFELIERGNGDKRLDYGSFVFITQKNLLAIENPALSSQMFMKLSKKDNAVK